MEKYSLPIVAPEGVFWSAKTNNELAASLASKNEKLSDFETSGSLSNDYTKICEIMGVVPHPLILKQLFNNLTHSFSSSRISTSREPPNSGSASKSTTARKGQQQHTNRSHLSTARSLKSPFSTARGEHSNSNNKAVDKEGKVRENLFLENVNNFYDSDNRRIGCFGFAFDNSTIYVLSKLLPLYPHTQALHLWNAQVNNEGLSMIAHYLAPQLRMLHVDWSISFKEQFSDFKKFNEDEEKEEKESDDNSKLEELKKLFSGLVGPESGLQSLSLRGNELTDEMGKLLMEELKSNIGSSSSSSLIHLDLSFNKLGSETVKSLSELLILTAGGEAGLISVDLSDNLIDDGCLELLTEPFLEVKLDKESAAKAKKQGIPIKVVNKVSFRAPNEKLVNLGIRNNKISNESIQNILSMSQNNPSFQKIDVRNNVELTDTSLFVGKHQISC